MAFRALLFSKSPETNTSITEACANAGIRVESCSDIFTAIEKGKTRVFCSVIADWADQPEASFLLKRARESAPNRETIAIAVVDHDPTKAELRDSHLDFLIYRPISVKEAEAVLAKACEKMKPLSAEEAREAFEENRDQSITEEATASRQAATKQTPPAHFQEPDPVELDYPVAAVEEESRERKATLSWRSVVASALVVICGFVLWNARDSIMYLTRTPEGKWDVLRESVADLFYMNKGTSTVVPTSGDVQQDAYFSRSGSSNTKGGSLTVAATQSGLGDAPIPLPKAADLPLPVPTVEHHDPIPVHVERVAIPDSMKNSAPIERPVVVTVTPAQMMPVSAPQSQPAIQQGNEPVVLSEEAQRALLIHSVDPVYPAEGMAQKLHGPVVLQAIVGRDGSVQDLKIVRGYFVLGKAAIAAVKQWRFQPYSLNGHPASTTTLITVNFNYPPG